MPLFRNIVFSSVVATSLSVTAQADVTQLRAQSFRDIYGMITQDGTNLSGTLVVMDDDDTLTMMPCPDQGSPATCQYVGGPAWFSWQTDLISKSGGTTLLPGQVALTDDQLFPISDLLLSLTRMDFADPTIPTVLPKFVKDGARIMSLTARDTDAVSTTEQQMQALAVSIGTEKTLLDGLSTHAPVWGTSAKSSMAGTESDFCGAKIPVAYQNGVFYATGQNKGEMLGCFLPQVDGGITNIVFVDDTEQNVQDVFNYFMDNQTAYTVTAIHFTQLAQHKAAFLKIPASGGLNAYQTAADLRWQVLKSALDLTLLEPMGLQ
jgi:hypothetical protein